MNRKLRYYYANRDVINEQKRNNRRNDVIEDVIRLRKELRARSLRDKIAKDTTQFNLREAYKPLLEGQTTQTKEITKTQKETSEEQLRQQDVQSREQQQRHEKLIEEIRKQPLIIPLIKSLNKSPQVVDVLNGKSDGSNLTGKEQHILNQLNDVDERLLITLINYYSSVPSTRYEETVSEIESGIVTSSETASTEEKLEMSEDLRKQEEEGKGLYDYLVGLHTYVGKPKIVEVTKMVFDKQENKDNFIQYLNSLNFKIYLNENPFRTIKTVHPDFYNEIQQLKEQKKGKGLHRRFEGNIKFLSSDPQELINKLNILIAEKHAGHNNVFNEISAITDELRRSGYLTVDSIKKIYKQIS